MTVETIHYGVEQFECEECEAVSHGEVTGQPIANVFAWQCDRCGHTQEV